MSLAALFKETVTPYTLEEARGPAGDYTEALAAATAFNGRVSIMGMGSRRGLVVADDKDTVQATHRLYCGPAETLTAGMYVEVGGVYYRVMAVYQPSLEAAGIGHLEADLLQAMLEFKETGWVNPTGTSDPATDWADDANAIDGSIATFAGTLVDPSGILWGTHAGVLSNKVRFYANKLLGASLKCDVWVQYDGVTNEQLVDSEAFADLTYQEVGLPRIGDITGVGFSVENIPVGAFLHVLQIMGGVWVP